MKKEIKRILVIRTCSMSEVAMTVPVLASLVKQYPDVEITLVTNVKYVPLFEHIPNVEIFPIEILTRHRGRKGVFRLFYDLRELPPFDLIVDLQGHFRNKFLSFLFGVLCGVRAVHVNMGNREKRKQTRRFRKKMKESLESTYSRYLDAFAKAKLLFPMNFDSIFPEKPILSLETALITGEKQGKWIGIAPFTKHKGKMLPLEKTEKVIVELLKFPDVKIFLFNEEEVMKDLFEEWEQTYPNVCSLVSKINLREELRIVANLDVMITMDSVNLHLASLVKTPAVSIWGATHRYSLGTVGWNQSRENVVETSLKCRPCSLTGDKYCRRGDYACLNEIALEQIVEKVKKILYERRA